MDSSTPFGIPARILLRSVRSAASYTLLLSAFRAAFVLAVGRANLGEPTVASQIGIAGIAFGLWTMDSRGEVNFLAGLGIAPTRLRAIVATVVGAVTAVVWRLQQVYGW